MPTGRVAEFRGPSFQKKFGPVSLHPCEEYLSYVNQVFQKNFGPVVIYYCEEYLSLVSRVFKKISVQWACNPGKGTVSWTEF